jgi:glucose-6-phosphate 1-dehydrogenase
MLFDRAVRMDMMQMTIMQVVYVVAMSNPRVFAVRAMFVVVVGVQVGHVEAPC